MGIRLEASIGCWFVRVEKEFQILSNMSVFPEIPVFTGLPSLLKPRWRGLKAQIEPVFADKHG